MTEIWFIMASHPRKFLRSTIRYFYRWATLPQRLAEMHDRLIALEKLARVSYSDDSLARVITKRGYRLCIKTQDKGVGRILLEQGSYEDGITHLLRKLWKPGMRVIEIGANIGYFTVQAADLVGASGKVWVFEANPEACDLLRLNLRMNGFSERCEIIPKAAHREIGEALFHVYEDMMGSSSLGDVDADFLGLGNVQPRSIVVPLIPIDDVIPEHESISVIKIDAEGSEPFVIEGMKKLLERNPEVILVMEFMPINLRSMQCDAQAFLHTLKSMRFSFRHINELGELEEISENEILRRVSTELYLTRNGT